MLSTMENHKRKREPENEIPRIKYHVEQIGRSFERLFKEKSHEELRNVVRKKLKLDDNTRLELVQLRDGKVYDLEDDDDFEAFKAVAHEYSSLDVRVSFSPQGLSNSGSAAQTSIRSGGEVSVDLNKKQPMQNKNKRSLPERSTQGGESMAQSSGVHDVASSGDSQYMPGPSKEKRKKEVQFLTPTRPDGVSKAKKTKTREEALDAMQMDQSDDLEPLKKKRKRSEHTEAADAPGEHIDSTVSVGVELTGKKSIKKGKKLSVTAVPQSASKNKVKKQKGVQPPVVDTSVARGSTGDAHLPVSSLQSDPLWLKQRSTRTAEEIVASYEQSMAARAKNPKGVSKNRRKDSVTINDKGKGAGETLPIVPVENNPSSESRVLGGNDGTSYKPHAESSLLSSGSAQSASTGTVGPSVVASVRSGKESNSPETKQKTSNSERASIRPQERPSEVIVDRRNEDPGEESSSGGKKNVGKTDSFNSKPRSDLDVASRQTTDSSGVDLEHVDLEALIRGPQLKFRLEQLGDDDEINGTRSDESASLLEEEDQEKDNPRLRSKGLKVKRSSSPEGIDDSEDDDSEVELEPKGPTTLDKSVDGKDTRMYGEDINPHPRPMSVAGDADLQNIRVFDTLPTTQRIGKGSVDVDPLVPEVLNVTSADGLPASLSEVFPPFTTAKSPASPSHSRSMTVRQMKDRHDILPLSAPDKDISPVPARIFPNDGHTSPQVAESFQQDRLRSPSQAKPTAATPSDVGHKRRARPPLTEAARAVRPVVRDAETLKRLTVTSQHSSDVDQLLPSSPTIYPEEVVVPNRARRMRSPGAASFTTSTSRRIDEDVVEQILGSQEVSGKHNILPHEPLFLPGASQFTQPQHVPNFTALATPEQASDTSSDTDVDMVGAGKSSQPLILPHPVLQSQSNFPSLSQLSFDKFRPNLLLNGAGFLRNNRKDRHEQQPDEESESDDEESSDEEQQSHIPKGRRAGAAGRRKSFGLLRG